MEKKTEEKGKKKAQRPMPMGREKPGALCLCVPVARHGTAHGLPSGVWLRGPSALRLLPLPAEALQARRKIGHCRGPPRLILFSVGGSSTPSAGLFASLLFLL